ncbi:MAG: 50S ribosomal protein L24 [Leptospirales bacterium]
MAIKSKKPIKTKLRVEDEVIVISGKSKNQRGKILVIDKTGGRVIVQGVNQKKRFVRPSQENPKGGVVEIEAPLQLSNVAYYDAKSKKGSRIKIAIDKNGKKTRVVTSSGKELG